ncbi:DUF4870 domain-containing protein [Bacteroides helcogenes]|uniref:Zinc-ribbon domain-containing protein n=1 Tax=Bacteroides helcogenes (strain ATCC 35417 / DSM 20613 / JCM 6297 / CCUG 15421 / P 36-108) TaxID=693979 RepID=E6STU6_BACT6|nr:zinc-ribbon domain-containing protein [Bacteroides helcogenes]ADV42299.1 hypothetical protein Bache_0269 [Bacteroides helcogenes P 36-108]MDY5237247.1 zinc-ribbon domain-containing protein [Bacteroides helcogenes]
MAYCSKCGTEITDGTKFCPSCGTPAGASAAQENRQQQQSTETKFSETMNTADTTTQFDPADVEKNKAMGVLAYLGILVLIPILAAKDSPFARYHANQGLILCIACILYGVAYSILSSIILAISWRLYFLVSIIGLVGVVFAVLCVIGIINAVNGRAKELPLIGKYKLLK